MCVQPFRHDDAVHRAVGLQQNLALGNVEIERIAFVARALHNRIGVVQRLENGSEEGTGAVVRPSVDRRLRLRVVQFGGRAHQDAMKAVRALAAVRADHHPDRQRATGLARHQRAQIVRDALGQHRHHAIRKVHRIAAGQRVAVERRARAHIKRDVGDRNIDDVTAFVVRIAVRSARRYRGRDWADRVRTVAAPGCGGRPPRFRRSGPVLAGASRPIRTPLPPSEAADDG